MNEEHFKELRDDIKDVKDNHLPHIYRELIKNTTDLQWLKKNHWVVFTAAMAALAAAIFNLL